RRPLLPRHSDRFGHTKCRQREFLLRPLGIAPNEADRCDNLKSLTRFPVEFVVDTARWDRNRKRLVVVRQLVDLLHVFVPDRLDALDSPAAGRVQLHLIPDRCFADPTMEWCDVIPARVLDDRFEFVSWVGPQLVERLVEE